MTPVEKLRHERDLAMTEAANARLAILRMAERNVHECAALSSLLDGTRDQIASACQHLELLQHSLAVTEQHQAAAFVTAILAGLRQIVPPAPEDAGQALAEPVKGA
jgi:hypothetical protein